MNTALNTNAPASTLMPDCYNDLGVSLRTAWAMLARSVVDRACGFHMPVVASVDADDKPQARTMILRQVNIAERTLTFHTDIRSPKIAQWHQRNDVCVLFYDHGEKIQLRISGTVSLHHDDAGADEAWLTSRASSQLTYGSHATPGSIIAAPSPAETQLSDDARKHFCMVVIKATSLEWLHLAPEGNRRALFTWPNDNMTATWLQP
jgi:pyridoxamine 5'-phosphate oxidase